MESVDFASVLGDAVALIHAHAWVPLLALAVGLAVRLCKSDKLVAWFPVVIPPRARAWVAVGLALVYGVVQKLAAGGSWSEALGGGLTAGAAAIAGHELLVEGLFGGREPGVPRPPPGAVGIVALLFLAGCPVARTAEEATDLVAASMACRAKGIHVARSGGPCEARRRALQDLAAYDPDCIALFADGGPGRFTCHDDAGPSDAGGDEGWGGADL